MNESIVCKSIWKLAMKFDVSIKGKSAPEGDKWNASWNYPFQKQY